MADPIPREVFEAFGQPMPASAVPSEVLAAFGNRRPPPPLGRTAMDIGRSFVRGAVTGPVNLAGQVWEGIKAAPYSLTHPEQLGKDVLAAGRQAVAGAPALLGMVLGLPTGPFGVIGGGMLGAGLSRVARGGTPGEAAEEMGGVGSLGVLGAYGSRGVSALRKAPGRYLSLPAERHATGAGMMEEIPRRFGVDDATVGALYRRAERLSATSTAESSLDHFRGRVSDMVAQIERSPVLQDKALLRQLKKTLDQLGPPVNLTTGGPVHGTAAPATPPQVDAIIKAVNHRIGNTEGAAQGVWKQLLGGLHEDMRAAARATGDPAFQAFSQAIRTAHENFLRQDLAEAVRTVGIVQQRTGKSVVTSPGKIVQWMATHPEWTEAVDKARPGLLDVIRADLKEIVPVTDVVGRSIPGQRYGSGRLVLGGALGHLAVRLLGLPPALTEAAAIAFGGLSPHIGMEMSSAYIRGSFQPVTTRASRAGAVGAVAGSQMGPPRPGTLPERVAAQRDIASVMSEQDPELRRKRLDALRQKYVTE